jgi:hypothetical protein
VDLVSYPKSFWGANERLPLFAETKTILSVSIVRVEFTLNGHPNNVVHVSDFCGKNGGIVELNVVSLAHTVFSYG